MYRCEFCKSVIAPNTPSRRVVVETRPALYPYRAKVNRLVKKGRERMKPDDPGGTGHEIVRECVACPKCAEDRAQ